MYKIFIVEDDNTISNLLQRHLEAWGYQATCATDFQHILEQFQSVSPQLVLLDLSLPFFNGYHWCQQIRKRSQVPILFLSSAADSMNIVLAINYGADDFICKPFDMNVLVAKIQAMLRRSYDLAGATEYLEHDGLILNRNSTTISYGNQSRDLTKNEYRILQVLLERKGKVVSRDTLMERLWETDSYVDENTLTVNVTRLRKKLSALGIEDYIKTKKGMGYYIG